MLSKTFCLRCAYGEDWRTSAHGGRVPYMLPADTEEMNRLDFQHYVLLRYALQGLNAAPSL
jgi:hypothetical protein